MGSRGSDYDCLREAESMRMGWSRRDLRCEVTCAENCTLCTDDMLSLYAEESQYMSPPMTDILGGVILNGISPYCHSTSACGDPSSTIYQSPHDQPWGCSAQSGVATLCKLTPPQLRIQEVRDCSSGTGRTSYLRLNIRTSLRAQRIDSFHSRSEYF